MAESGDERAAGTLGRSHLRAARADRERVIEVLKTAFVQGMLDRDEFDLRVGQTLVSRTYADLAAITAGLPTLLVPARPPRQEVPASMGRAAKAAICGIAAFGLLAAALVMGPAMVMLVLVFYLMGAFVGVAEILSARHNRRAR
jgi:Domain of unknown function (DUF1707)